MQVEIRQLLALGDDVVDEVDRASSSLSSAWQSTSTVAPRRFSSRAKRTNSSTSLRPCSG